MTPNCCDHERERVDLLGSRVGWFVWGLPAALFIMGLAWGAARAWLWIPSLVVAGVACIANASRCGRLHCFLTGPVFMLAALLMVLDAFGLMSFDWHWVLTLGIAGVALGYGLEWIQGKYVGAQRSRS